MKTTALSLLFCKRRVWLTSWVNGPTQRLTNEDLRGFSGYLTSKAQLGGIDLDGHVGDEVQGFLVSAAIFRIREYFGQSKFKFAVRKLKMPDKEWTSRLLAVVAAVQGSRP